MFTVIDSWLEFRNRTDRRQTAATVTAGVHGEPAGIVGVWMTVEVGVDHVVSDNIVGVNLQDNVVIMALEFRRSVGNGI